MMWLNWSVATINAMLQLLDIYRLVYHFKNFVAKQSQFTAIILRDLSHSGTYSILKIVEF